MDNPWSPQPFDFFLYDKRQNLPMTPETMKRDAPEKFEWEYFTFDVDTGRFVIHVRGMFFLLTLPKDATQVQQGTKVGEIPRELYLKMKLAAFLDGQADGEGGG